MPAFDPPYEYLVLGPRACGGNTWTNEFTFAADGTLDSLAWAVHSPAAGSLTDALVRITSVAGTPPNYAYDVTDLAVVSGNVGIGATTHASQTFAPTGTGDLVVSFGSPATVTLGQKIGLRVLYSSGTIDGSNRATFRTSYRGLSNTGSFPVSMTTTNGGTSWSRELTAAGTWAVKIGGRWYGLPFSTGNTTSGFSVDNRGAGIKFELPPDRDTLRAIGNRFLAGLGVSSGNIDLVLEDASGTELLAETIPCQHTSGATSSQVDWLWNDIGATLNAGEFYRLWVRRNGTSFALNYLTLPSATYREAWPGGDRVCMTEYNGSTWTDYTDRILPWALIVSEYTSPAGSLVMPARRLVLPPSVQYRKNFPLIQPVTNVTNVIKASSSRLGQTQVARHRSPPQLLPIDRPVPTPFPAPPRREVRESIRVSHRTQNVPSIVDRQVVIPSPARRERTQAVIPHRRRELISSIVDRQIVVPAAAKRERATSIVAMPRLRYLPSIVDRQVVIPGAPRREHRTATVVDRRRELITSREQVIVPTAPRRDHRSTTILARHRELITSRNDVLVPAPARRHPIHTMSTRLDRKLLPYETIRTEQVPLPLRPRVIVRNVQVPRRQQVAGVLLASIVTNVVMVSSRRTIR